MKRIIGSQITWLSIFCASARKKRIVFCLKDNRKGVSLKSPPIARKGGIARIARIAGKEAIERIGGIVIIVIIVIIDTIDTINTINTIGTIISISLRGRQSRSEALLPKGWGRAVFPKQRD